LGCEDGQRQDPAAHSSVPAQRRPQAPQLFLSVCTSMHELPHQAWPVGQHSLTVATQRCGLLGQAMRPPGQPQLRPLHTRSPVQRLPQAPQLSRLLKTFVQTPLQTTLLGATHWQRLITQVSAPLQVVPQAPQLK
jgi:hypothetical protein